MRLFRRPFERRFPGTWDDRLADLFEAGVDFRGRSVLVAGALTQEVIDVAVFLNALRALGGGKAAS